MNRNIFSIFLLLILSTATFAQQDVSRLHSEYIEKYKTLAIREMKLYKIPASITLAQGIIESNCGNSPLARQAKNHFGIKCQKDWTGEKFLYDDDTLNECFRKYNNADESFRDHSIFLTSRSRYAALFTLPINDYKGWAYGLKFTGYATNPEYAAILIRTIENDKLYQYDDTTLFTATARSEDKMSQADQTVSEKAPSKVEKVPGVVYSSTRILFRENYQMPGPEAFEFAYTSKLGRKVYVNNGVHLIFARPDDSWYGIAKEFNLYSSQVYRQNDLREHDDITAGQIIYLEPKKKRLRESIYKVETGESMYSISQLKCIRIKYLLKINKMVEGDEPEPGVILNLRNTSPRTALFM